MMNRTRSGLLLAVAFALTSPHALANDPAEWKLGVEVGASSLFANRLGDLSPSVGAGLERRLNDTWWLTLSASAQTSTSESELSASSFNGASLSVGAIAYANPDDDVRVGGAVRVSAGSSSQRFCGSLAGLGGLGGLSGEEGAEGGCTENNLTSIGLAADLIVTLTLTDALELRFIGEVIDGNLGWSSTRDADTEATHRTLALTMRPRLALYLAF